MRRLVILTAAFLVAGCSDAVDPTRSPIRAPLFDAASGGIALDQVNGSLNERGTELVKGFNPVSPHNGDAIVVTFYWVGPSGVPTVTDYLTTIPNTPVGNTYQLVEYVTQGGVSMATFVATNVQHFPDAWSQPGGDSILAVRGTFDAPVPDGGLLISAWTGVNSVSAQAVGAHRSNGGTAFGSMIDGPGAIPVDAGALAYAVTMSNGWGSRTGPTGFTSLMGMSDLLVNSDGEYDAEFAVQGTAGSVNPQWTWSFTVPGSWVASVLALNPAPPPPGTLAVTTTTTGSNLDPDGYSVMLDGAGAQAVSTNGSISVPGLTAGSHTVTLSGVASNCQIDGGDTQIVSVPSGGTGTASFALTCVATGDGGKLTGGGKLGDGRDFATFGAEGAMTGGKVEWVQHCVDGVNAASPTCGLGSFTFSGSVGAGSYGSPSNTCRSWTSAGTAKFKDSPSLTGSYTLRVNRACDNGEPGRGTDYVDVTMAGYHLAGYLSGGNLQLHKT